MKNKIAHSKETKKKNFENYPFGPIFRIKGTPAEFHGPGPSGQEEYRAAQFHPNINAWEIYSIAHYNKGMQHFGTSPFVQSPAQKAPPCRISRIWAQLV
jgi:hypothetical protein